MWSICWADISHEMSTCLSENKTKQKKLKMSSAADDSPEMSRLKISEKKINK